MARERPSVVVDRPVAEVFAFVTDLDKAPQWAPQMGRLVERSGPLAEGMSFGEERRFAGRRSLARWTVTRFVPQRVFGLAMRWGPMRGDFAYNFESLGEGSTRITQDIDFRLAGPLAPLSGIITSEAIKEESRELMRLKELLERR
jgi:uncharacterized protein YndB with AHSA1/START domain